MSIFGVHVCMEEIRQVLALLQLAGTDFLRLAIPGICSEICKKMKKIEGVQ